MKQTLIIQVFKNIYNLFDGDLSERFRGSTNPGEEHLSHLFLSGMYLNSSDPNCNQFSGTITFVCPNNCWFSSKQILIFAGRKQ